MAIHPVLPLCLLVLHGVEKDAAMRCPHQRTHPLRPVRQQLSRTQVLDVQCVLTKAGRIRGVREQQTVGANR